MLAILRLHWHLLILKKQKAGIARYIWCEIYSNNKKAWNGVAYGVSIYKKIGRAHV
jgi:hypothetical protein